MEELLIVARDTVANRATEVLQAGRRLKVEEELAKLTGEGQEQLLDAFFSDEIPTNDKFYDLLAAFVFNLGYGDKARALGACLWRRAYARVCTEGREKFLFSILDGRGTGLWEGIRGLPHFLSEVRIASEIAAPWFLALYQKIKNDLAGGSYYEGLRIYGCSFPEAALEVFLKYYETLEEANLAVAAILLGACRISPSVRDNIGRIDKQLKASPKSVRRRCYYKSLATSFELGGQTTEDLSRELTDMMGGEEVEIEEAVRLLCACTMGKRENPDIVEFAINWLKENRGCIRSDEAKHLVVNLIRMLCSRHIVQRRSIEMSDAYEIVADAMPIPKQNVGTWDLIEQFLVERAEDGVEEFEAAFWRLVESDAEGMVHLFERREAYLKMVFSRVDVRGLVTRLLLSPDDMKRHVGRVMFEGLDLDALDLSELQGADEEQLELALLESIRRPMFDGVKTAKYLVSLARSIEAIGGALEYEFKNELAVQAINYGGGCLRYLEERIETSAAVKEACAKGRKHFELLEEMANNPAVSFTFPEYRKAVEMARREHDGRVREGVQELSVFAAIVKRTDIIYGENWSILRERRLGESRGLESFQHTMELPRLELIDPEGMAIRRIIARRRQAGAD